MIWFCLIYHQNNRGSVPKQTLSTGMKLGFLFQDMNKDWGVREQSAEGKNTLTQENRSNRGI